MTTSNPPATSPRYVLTRYLDALVAADLESIADSFADDAVWTLHGDLPLAGTRRGRDEIMAFLLNAGALYREGTQSFEFADILVDGNRAVLEWRVRGVASASGLSYDNDYCGVFEIRDGRIVSVREYLGTLHAAQTLFPTSLLQIQRQMA